MINDTKISDEELAKKVQNGHKQSFDLLISRYSEKIFRYAKRFLYNLQDAEDATQDVFIKTYENIQSFNLNKRFSPWIYRLAHNTFINIIRKNKREKIQFIDLDTVLPHFVSHDTLEKEISSKFDLKLLEKVIKKLNPKYREIIILFYYEEKSYQEISDILKIPASTVGVRLKRAKQQLKNISNDHFQNKKPNRDRKQKQIL